MRWRFDLQLTVQVASDIVAISLLTYASNGISSGLGLLLLTTLAAAGLIARGRLTLFYAALASIAVLLAAHLRRAAVRRAGRAVRAGGAAFDGLFHGRVARAHAREVRAWRARSSRRSARSISRTWRR